MILSYSFIVGFASHSWTEIQHFLGMAAAQQKVLVCMGFLLATVVFSLFMGIFRTLASSLRAIDQEIWLCFGYQWAVSHGFPIALRRHPHFRQRLLQDRQEQVNPVVGLWLTDLKL